MFSMSWGSRLARAALAAVLAAATLAGMPTVDANDRSMPTGGDFTLASVQGPVSLSDHRGKVVLLFFGYTNCPDFCPTTLSLLAQVYEILGDEAAAGRFAWPAPSGASMRSGPRGPLSGPGSDPV